MFPPTTIVAFETDLIFFLIKVTGVIASAMTVTPTIASCHELYNKTATSPTIPNAVEIKDCKLLIIVFEAVSGSDKNLVRTRPEEFTS